MFYLVCARSEDGSHAAKFGFAKHEATLSGRVENARTLLAAHGFHTIVHTFTGQGDRKLEGAVHRSFRARFARPPTGPHGDGASECYIGADVTHCVQVLAEHGLGVLAEFQLMAEQQGEDVARVSLQEQMEHAVQQFHELQKRQSRQRSTRGWFGLLTIGSAAYVVIPYMVTSLRSVPLAEGPSPTNLLFGSIALAASLIVYLWCSLWASQTDVELRDTFLRLQQLAAAVRSFKWHVAPEADALLKAIEGKF